MTGSVREAALNALGALISAALPAAEVRRNLTASKRIPPGGLVCLRDGEAGDPEVYLGQPPLYAFEHTAEIEAQVGQNHQAARDSALSVLVLAIEAAITADPTLGGLVEMVDVGSPELITEDIEGGDAIKAALLPVVITYITTKRTG